MGFFCGSSAEKLVEIEFVIKQNGQKVGLMKKITSKFNLLGIGDLVMENIFHKS